MDRKENLTPTYNKGKHVKLNTVVGYLGWSVSVVLLVLLAYSWSQNRVKQVNIVKLGLIDTASKQSSILKANALTYHDNNVDRPEGYAYVDVLEFGKHIFVKDKDLFNNAIRFMNSYIKHRTPDTISAFKKVLGADSKCVVSLKRTDGRPKPLNMSFTTHRLLKQACLNVRQDTFPTPEELSAMLSVVLDIIRDHMIKDTIYEHEQKG